MTDFIWPSDLDRAENDELARVCDYLEEVLEERDKALEREAALAAHVDEFRDFVEYVRKSVRRNGEYAPLITQEMDELLGTPYQRNYRQKRDLIKQAEAINKLIQVMRQPMTKDGQPWLIRVEDAEAMANDLLRQAEELTK